MKTKMSAKKIVSLLIAVLMCVSVCSVLAACNKENPAETPETTVATVSSSDEAVTEDLGVWADASYKEDTIIGKGTTTFYFEVQVEGYSVTFTVNTDKKTVGDALQEHSLIEGEKGPYGLYVKKVNGILADYDVNSTYWNFTKDGEMMMTGVDGEDIENGAHYEMVYTKG